MGSYAVLADIVTPSSGTPPTIVGLLIAAILALAGVVVFLFKRYDTRNDQIATERKGIEDERKAWAVEKETLKTDYSKRCNELSAEYAKGIAEQMRVSRDRETELLRVSREREDMLRRENADMIETMTSERRLSEAELNKTLDKLIERIISGNVRRG